MWLVVLKLSMFSLNGQQDLHLKAVEGGGDEWTESILHSTDKSFKIVIPTVGWRFKHIDIQRFR